MSVMPGFGGQHFDGEVRSKVRALRSLRPDLWLAIDGGIKASNACEVVSDGVNQLVVGSAVFRPDSTVAQALDELRRAVAGTAGNAAN
jgi:ribulose-phosphate 3-epimerase